MSGSLVPGAAAELRWELRPAAALAAHAAEWDCLAQEAGDAPFLRTDFLLPALRHFGNGKERLLLGREGGVLACAALVAPAKLGAWQTFQPSQLPLGPVVSRPGLPIDDLAAQMLRALPLTALQLGLTQLDPLLHPRPADMPRCTTLDYIETAWIDVEGDYAAYWAARGKNLRQNMAKQRRKLEADATAVQLEVLSTPEQVADGLRDYAALESAGWKAQGGTAIDLTAPQGRFYADMLSAFASKGQARVYRYRLGDKPAAVDLCIESARMQVVLKTTYDETYKTLSPAFLMREDILQHEWPLKRVPRFEFYGRRMEWHQRWTEASRSLYHLNAYRLDMLLRMKARARGGSDVAA